jgi:hypothetical protein
MQWWSWVKTRRDLLVDSEKEGCRNKLANQAFYKGAFEEACKEPLCAPAMQVDVIVGFAGLLSHG